MKTKNTSPSSRLKGKFHRFTLVELLVVIAVIMTFVAFISYMPETRRQVKERFSPEGKAKARAEKEARQAEKANKK